PGLPELIERAHSDDPRQQRAALEALGDLAEAAGPAVPVILRLLRDPRASVLEAAIGTLARLGTLAEPALHAAWAEAGWNTDDGFGNYRLPVPLIDACARFGPRSRLVASIVKALDTANDPVPEAARAALLRFGAEAFDSVLEDGSKLERG